MPQQHPREDGGFSAEGRGRTGTATFPSEKKKKCGLAIFGFGLFVLVFKKEKKIKGREKGR